MEEHALFGGCEQICFLHIDNAFEKIGVFDYMRCYLSLLLFLNHSISFKPTVLSFRVDPWIIRS